MKIRFDYSWLPEAVRTALAKNDPTPEDLAITDRDVAMLGDDKFAQFVTQAERLAKIPSNTTPSQIIMSPTGETWLLSNPTSTWKGSEYRRLPVLDKKGATQGWLDLRASDGAITEPMQVGGIETIDRLCSGRVQQRGECDSQQFFLLTHNNDRFIYPNRVGFTLRDHHAPQFTLNSFAAFTKLDPNLVVAKRRADGIVLSIPAFLSPQECEEELHLTLLADGRSFPLAGGEIQSVTFPDATRDIRFRVTDSNGNSTEIAFTRIDAGDRVYLLPRQTEEATQQSLFQQYVRQLIQAGYEVVPSADLCENPLAKLIEEHGEALFSSPGAHGDRQITIPIFAVTSLRFPNGETGEADNIVRVTDWLRGDVLVAEGSVTQHSDEASDADARAATMKMHILLRLLHTPTPPGDPLTLDAVPPGNVRGTPQLIAQGTHIPEIPEPLRGLKWAFGVTSDVAWGRTVFENGGGDRPITIARQGQALIDHPIKIVGQLETMTVELPAQWTHFPPSSKERMIAIGGQILRLREITDPFGHTILFSPGQSTLLIIPKNETDAEHGLSIDLSAFGLGIVKDPVRIAHHAPIGRAGNNGQYALYAPAAVPAPHLQNAIDQISAAERDFGFRPGTIVHNVRVVEEEEVNAGVRATNPETVNITEGLLGDGDGFATMGYHETLHAIDLVLKITDHPLFQAFWKRVSMDHPAFLLWISEHNFLPTQIGGHAWDNAMETFASLGCTQFHPALSEWVAQSDPQCVTLYAEVLEVVKTILTDRAREGKLTPDAPIFAKIDRLITTAKETEHADPLALLYSDEYYAKFGPYLTPRTVGNSRWQLSLKGSIFGGPDAKGNPIGGVLAGGRADYFLYKPSGDDRFTSTLYSELNLALQSEPQFSIIPEIGATAGVRFPGITMGAQAGYALRYEPATGDLLHGLSTGIFLDVLIPITPHGFLMTFGVEILYFPSVREFWVQSTARVPL